MGRIKMAIVDGKVVIKRSLWQRLEVWWSERKLDKDTKKAIEMWDRELAKQIMKQSMKQSYIGKFTGEN